MLEILVSFPLRVQVMALVDRIVDEDRNSVSTRHAPQIQPWGTIEQPKRELRFFFFFCGILLNRTPRNHPSTQANPADGHVDLAVSWATVLLVIPEGSVNMFRYRCCSRWQLHYNRNP